jgi:hypothetical protein
LTQVGISSGKRVPHKNKHAPVKIIPQDETNSRWTEWRTVAPRYAEMASSVSAIGVQLRDRT